jgi:glycosyltransferase involved in cell wall biosynthesis
LQTRLPYRLHYYVLSARDEFRTWEAARNPTIKPVIIPGIRVNLLSRATLINVCLSKYLDRIKPELIILGGAWSERACFVAKHYARRRKIPFVPWVVAKNDERMEGLLGRTRQALSSAAQRRFLRDVDCCWTRGSKARKDVIHQGIAEDRVVNVKSFIEEQLFLRDSRFDAVDRASEREKLGFDDAPLLLCVARLMPRKGVTDLLAAFERLRRQTSSVQLLLIGDGPQRKMVSDFQEAHPRGFRWLSTVPYREMPLYYFISDICVVPSYFEDWGNVVNESHCMKVPLICSDGVTASVDLIEHGSSGLLYRAGNVGELVARIEYAMNHRSQMAQMAERGHDFIRREWNMNVAAGLWHECIDSVLHGASCE